MTAVPLLDRRGDYVSAVAVELADLAADDRAELIEELDDHIAALLEDRPEVDLIGELGTPRAYAVELRTAAGLTGSHPARPTLRAQARALTEQVQARVPNQVRPWLQGLRPVWWVLRGYLLVAGVCHVLGQGWARDGLGVLLPAPGGVWGAGLLLAVLAAAASVRLGGWRPRTVVQRATVVVLGLAALGSGLILAGSARYAYAGSGGVYVDTQYVRNCPIELSNLYAYDAAGKPIDNVRLFDQNGNPFDIAVFACNGGQFAPDGFVNAYPWPTATSGEAQEPSGPPPSLSPLPGATVSPTGSTPLPSPAAGATTTPTR